MSDKSEGQERRRARLTDAPPECIWSLPEVAFETGSVLIEEGARSGTLYFLASGVLEILKGGTPIVEVRERGAAIGEMSVLLHAPHGAEVRASEPVVVHVTTEPQAYLLAHPEVALYVARLLAQRLSALNSYLLDVKLQFEDEGHHLAMVNEVLDTLMNKHPRRIDRRGRSGM